MSAGATREAAAESFDGSAAFLSLLAVVFRVVRQVLDADFPR
jgi:hypothetical protein